MDGRIAMVLVAAVGVAVVAVPTAYSIGSDETVIGPSPSHTFSYDKGEERLRITVSDGTYAAPQPERETSQVAVKRLHRSAGSATGVPVTISGPAGVSQDGLWYDRNNRSVSSQVPAAGDSVTIVADGTDQDGDGTAGVEPGEVYLAVVTIPEGGSATVAEVSVRDGEVCTGAESTCDPRP